MKVGLGTYNRFPKSNLKLKLYIIILTLNVNVLAYTQCCAFNDFAYPRISINSKQVMYKFNSKYYSTILYKRYRSFFFINLIYLFLVKINLIMNVDSIIIRSCCYRLTLLHMPMIIRESHGPRLRMSKKRKYIRKKSVNNY